MRFDTCSRWDVIKCSEMSQYNWKSDPFFKGTLELSQYPTNVTCNFFKLTTIASILFIHVLMLFIQDEGLVIFNAARSNTGKYLCTARNSAGRSNGEINLDVGWLPIITDPPVNIGVDIGQFTLNNTFMSIKMMLFHIFATLSGLMHKNVYVQIRTTIKFHHHTETTTTHVFNFRFGRNSALCCRWKPHTKRYMVQGFNTKSERLPAERFQRWYRPSPWN